MAWPSSRYKTAANGGSWVPADMNGVQDQYVRSAGIERDDLEQAITQQLGLTTTGAGHGGAAVRRGKSIIATDESRTNTAYGTLATPDQVANIVLPTDGLLCVRFQALVKNSVDGAGKIAIFVGANQLKVVAGGAPVVQEASISIIGGAPVYTPVLTGQSGLFSLSSVADAVFVATGQVIGATEIWVPAGTYTVSVQYKASSGSINAKERKLWVSSIGF